MNQLLFRWRQEGKEEVEKIKRALGKGLIWI